MKLKSNGWHFKLQNFIFSEPEHLNNMCPYFWLTIFCLMVVPFVGAFKFLIWVLAKPMGKLMDLIDSAFNKMFKVQEIRYISKINNKFEGMTNTQAYNLFKTIYTWSEPDLKFDFLWQRVSFTALKSHKRLALVGIFKNWKKENDDWKDRIYNHYKLEQHNKELLEKAKQDKKDKMLGYAEKAKLLVLLPLGIVGIYLTYWIGLIVVNIMENPVNIFYGVLFALVILIVGLGGFASLIIFGESYGEKGRAYKMVNYAIFKPVKKVFSPVGSVFSFFYMGFSAFMKDYCPMIEWEKEDDS